MHEITVRLEGQELEEKNYELKCCYNNYPGITQMSVFMEKCQNFKEPMLSNPCGKFKMGFFSESCGIYGNWW